MNTLIRRLALLLAGLMPAFGFAAAETADPDKKLIVFGYETQMPADIATRMHVYEASPFRGMGLGDERCGHRSADPFACVKAGVGDGDRVLHLT